MKQSNKNNFLGEKAKRKKIKTNDQKLLSSLGRMRMEIFLQVNQETFLISNKDILI